MPITWSQLKYIRNNRNARGYRSAEIEEKYQKYKSLYTEKDIVEIIQEKYLRNTSYAIVLNDFPYDLEKGILHYVMWLNKDFDFEDTNKIKSIIENTFFHKEIIFFRNTTQNQSVKQLQHYHIFVR